MKVDYPPHVVLNLFNDIPDRISYATELSVAARARSELLDLFNEVEQEVYKLKDTTVNEQFSLNYVNQLWKFISR